VKSTEPSPPSTPPVPVTVIGGYLGAGKTTLVNRMLRQANGLRIAVLVNEFGELPIDADLIESRNENVINIAGGCVCCSYGSDLMAALMDLQQVQPAPDHILIEASGVALPEAIAQSVTLISRYVIDGVIVLADAETITKYGADRYLAGTIKNQLAAADIVLLNKVDLPEPDALEATRQWLAIQCADVHIVETKNAGVSLPAILGAHTEPFARFEKEHHHHTSPHAEHDTVVMSVEHAVDPEDLAMRLADPELDLIRSKGFVEGLDGKIHAVQTVGRRWNLSLVSSAPTDIGKVVCIRYGKSIDRDAISQLAGRGAH
jgi:G3E family GTPase